MKIVYIDLVVIFDKLDWFNTYNMVKYLCKSIFQIDSLVKNWIIKIGR